MEKHNPLGYEQITGLSAVKGLTPVAGARFALIVPESQNVRFRDDRTGEPDPVVLAHERCHAKGGSERDCR